MVGHLARAVLPRVLGAVLGAVLVSGCGPTQDEGPTSATTQPTVAATLPPSDGPVTGPVNEPDTTPDTTPDTGTALASLATLPVKGRAATAGYHRERFGQTWLDADRNGCDTRNDMLTRDLSNPVYKDGTRDCVVLSGDLADPYTATRIRFVQGDGTLVDIDHVVALGNVWVTGGSGWGIRKRAAIANDPLNLLPVDASANRQKGDGDAATWLPSNKPFRCAYVARQVTVKAKYGLWVTAPERGAIVRVLSGCPEERLADDSGAPTTVDQNITDPYDRPTDPGGTARSTTRTVTPPGPPERPPCTVAIPGTAHTWTATATAPPASSDGPGPALPPWLSGVEAEAARTSPRPTPTRRVVQRR